MSRLLRRLLIFKIRAGLAPSDIKPCPKGFSAATPVKPLRDNVTLA